MVKFLFLIVLAFGVPVSTISQAAQSACSPPGDSGSQSQAISRIGVGTTYTLTAIIKTERTVPNGSATSSFTTSFQARDSQGHVRIDNPSFCAIDRSGQPHWDGSVTVFDPVANTYTSWQVNFFFPIKTVAVANALFADRPDPPTAQDEFRSAQILSQSSDNDPQAEKHIQYKVEDLGKRTIAGLEASGMRITRTYPAGTLVSSSLPITEVEDKWVSDQYSIILMDIKNNSVSALGKSSYEVTNFTPGEPDASLFQPPAVYMMNDRTATQ